ncbi:lysozyme [Prauserella cavernicola]|uniref:lysozyme n=1 Tax=Prauserella cavernicola TaxID=2800127 RepID=A0A934QR28_9PSEU|nr:lysozyme [Prauserella cavernicola]MBK1784815.1 lysozyme [Prauserella cavernicola]
MCRSALAGFGVAVFAASTLTYGGSAAQAEEFVKPDYRGAEQRHAGSQIALHEGVTGSPSQDAYLSTAKATVLGHDVSGWQGDVDWPAAAADGAKFVYVKATEGTGFTSDHFAQQYNGSHKAGLIRGAYHFGRPDISKGAAQAHYFVDNGGGWTKDGKTLPGALDLEYNPYGESCYDRKPSVIVAWIRDFSNAYKSRTGRTPMIYTSTSWWKKCTGNSTAFGKTNPLWLARYAPEIGELPAGWDFQSIWQFSDAGRLPGDQNFFNGKPGQLTALAAG